MTYYCELVPDADSFRVVFPDMPNVFAFGSTREEALKHGHEALNGVLESELMHDFPSSGPGNKAASGYFAIEVEPHIALALELRKLRGKRRQREIAAELNLSYQAYQRLENPRKANPTVKTLARLAKAYGKQLNITFS